MITTMNRAIGWVLAGLSAMLWGGTAWVMSTFEGVTGPAILLGWLIIAAIALTVLALVLLGSDARTRRRGR